MPLSLLDILIICLFLTLVFGSKKLPQLSRSIGEGISNFKQSITGAKKEEKEMRLPPQ